MQADTEQGISTANTNNPTNTALTVASTTTTTQPYSNHLTAQHGNIGCQLFTSAATGLTGSPIAQIPGRMMQVAISVRTFFQPAEKITSLEKTAHGIQAILAITLFGIALLRYQENEECNDTTMPLCKNEVLCQSLYYTMLLIGWGPSQMTNYSQKQDIATPETTNNTSTPGGALTA